MFKRPHLHCCLALAGVLSAASQLPAQAPSAFAPNRSDAPAAWRAPRARGAAVSPAVQRDDRAPASTLTSSGRRADARLAQNPGQPGASPPPVYQSAEQPSAAPVAARRTIAKVTSGSGALPHDQGQVWREYDITPYTGRIEATKRPEQAIVDWILRETGYEVWHSEPLGFLTANNRSLKVYHAPAMHDVVAEVVDRFVNEQAESQIFGLRVVTIDSPNWRAPAQRMLKPVDVQTQGVQAWLLQKEDAALLLAELRKRSDFREHSSPHLMVNNGQSTVVSATRPTSYIRDVVPRPNAWPGFEPEMAQIDEGFAIELSPLLSLDGQTIDAILKCNIDQVEKLREVMLEAPNPVAPRQRTKIEVPQVSHCRLHERFRWPTNMVLLVGLGVVATPVPTERNPNLLTMAIGMPQAPPRADLLVFVEARAQSAQTAAPVVRTGSAEGRRYQGRY